MIRMGSLEAEFFVPVVVDASVGTVPAGRQGEGAGTGRMPNASILGPAPGPLAAMLLLVLRLRLREIDLENCSGG